MILSPDHQVDLYVRPLSGNKLLRLTRGRAVEASPCWSPDGKNVCFVSDQNGRPRIYSVPVTGGTPKQLPSVGRDKYICYLGQFGVVELQHQRAYAL